MTRIALAQIQSKPGDVRWNVQHHLDFCELAKRHHAELICFPELSITNYEPGLASTYRMELDDPGLEELRSFSHKNNLIICIGAPRPTPAGLLISCIFFVRMGITRCTPNSNCTTMSYPTLCRATKRSSSMWKITIFFRPSVTNHFKVRLWTAE